LIAQTKQISRQQATQFSRALFSAPFAQPTRQTSHDPTRKGSIRRRLRKSNTAGSLSAFAHSQPDIPNSTEAQHSASLRLRSLPGAQAQPTQPARCQSSTDAAPHSPPRPHPDHPAPTHHRKCSAEYSPALAHLNPTTRTTNKPLNSARQSLHSLHFVTLSFRSVGKRCSAEKNPHRRHTPLRSVCATCRARGPTDAGPHCPHSPPAPATKSHTTAHCKPSSTFAGRTRFIPPPLREYAPRSSMKRPATAPEGAERRIKNPTVS
jgi:hypothetical protein